MLTLSSLIATALFGSLILGGIVAAWDLTRFLSETPEFESHEDLYRLRRLATRHMYAALVVILIAVGGAIAIVIGVIIEEMSFLDYAVPVGIAGSMSIVGAWVRSLELQVRRLPCADDDLEDERDEIVHIWEKEMFPNWDQLERRLRKRSKKRRS